MLSDCHVLIQSCRQAAVARDANIVSRSPERIKGLDPGVSAAASQAAGRIVGALNEKGIDATFAPADLRLLESFTVAVSAVDCLAAGPTCPQVEAKRVIAEFNLKGADAAFERPDEAALREFHQKRNR